MYSVRITKCTDVHAVNDHLFQATMVLWQRKLRLRQTDGEKGEERTQDGFLKAQVLEPFYRRGRHGMQGEMGDGDPMEIAWGTNV